jgi:type VI protein secretion system component VasK
LKILSDSVNSPLVLVLKVFAEQTKAILNNQSSFDTTKSDQTDLGSSSNSDMKRFTKFIVGLDDSPMLPDLKIVIIQYEFINGVVEKIKGGDDLIKDFSIKSDEFQTSLKTIQNATNDVTEFQNLLINPINMSWRSILSDASSYLNDQWKSQVWDAYNKILAGSFPFSEKGSDAPLQDFDDFFNPQNGVLWRFINSELNQFKGDLKTNKMGNQGISFSREFKSALKEAEKISSILFKGGNLSLAFRLESKFPVSKEIAGKKEGLVQQLLMIDGVGKNYEMGGSPVETFHRWPNKDGIPEAILEVKLVNTRYGSKSIRYKGDWALFKLINQASISPGDMTSQIVLTWKFSSLNQYDIDVSYILTAEGSKHPFSRDFFSSFILPKTVN